MQFNVKLIIYIFLGVVCSLIPYLVLIWFLYILFFDGVYRTIADRGNWKNAIFAAASLAGMELIFRMARIGLPHEVTKYSVIFVLIIGLMVRSSFSKGAIWFIIFFLLLTPSIFLLADEVSLEKARQSISFNLSGPLCLALAGLLSYRKSFSINELARVLREILYPLTALIVWLFIRTPSLSSVSFGFGSSYSLSGYGPNQMSSILGAGILIIGISIIFKIPVFKNVLLSFLLLILLTYRALLTFSRGGIFTVLLILILLLFFYFLFSSEFRSNAKKSLLLFAFLISGAVAIFFYINSKTENALVNRYAGVSYGRNVGWDKYTSGRLEIFLIDLEIFRDNPFMGIGPGKGNLTRVDYGYREKTAAHIEYTRLLAEHGAFGILALFVLFGFPLFELLSRSKLYYSFFLITGTLFCFSFMMHSATRLALPMFLYGFSFIYIEE